MNFNEIVFVNFFNNGDLHISREFVKKIKETFPNYKYSYAHKYNPYVLQDLQLVYYDIKNIPINKPGFGFYCVEDKLFLNTWYNSYNQKFNVYGITFDTIYDVFDYNCKQFFNISLYDIDSSPESFFPSIDFKAYKTDKIDLFFNNTNNNFHKKILICNGPALSGQADNFSFSFIINNLSVKYPNCLFIYTNKDSLIINKENVKYSSDIIGFDNFNLNENSYISNFCDIIIGRSSGVYTFSLTKHNLFKTNKIMISFSSISQPKYWLGSKFSSQINYTSNVLNFENSKNAQYVIEGYLTG